jgi:cell division septal protein FtsQ
MSTGGRWRVAMAGVRTAALLALLTGCAWGAWMVFAAWNNDPAKIPALAKAVPVKPPELKTMRDGVLDNAWLARTLELPPGVSLMELDLDKLQARVLADQQVLTANVRKIFPDRLEVQITERMPVARVRVEIGDVQRDLLVARDGILFFGTGFDPSMIRTLPWLDGVTLSRDDGVGFQPIAHMDIVAQLLAEAQFSAPHQYFYWQSLSLARLGADREIEVTLKSGTKALFSAKGNFFVQLANFDNVLERLSNIPGARARVDLTLGREVPVRIEQVASNDLKSPAATSAAVPLHPILFTSRPTTKREL